MSDTPRLGLPLLAAGQAQKHVTHNDALMRLDALVHLVVASRTQTAPPASPGETSAYIVPAGGSGVFAGRQDDLAIFEDGGWSFLALTPAAGDTGNLTVQLAPAAGAVTFRGIKLETGSAPSPWQARSLTQERQLCERYYWAPGASLFMDAYQQGTCYLMQMIVLPTCMRTIPTPRYAVSMEANILGGGRMIMALSPHAAEASIRAATTGRCYAKFENIEFDAEL